MRIFNLLLVVCATLYAASTPVLFAQTKPTTQGFSQTEGDNLSVTEHQLTIDGKPLKYKATAGTMRMKDEAGKPRADFFFVAYEKLPEEGEPQDDRPVTFVFNGGPGAASVWLHLGTAGPHRIELNPDGSAPAPPYRLVPNEQTWLTYTDLVLIDPVGTGFSRPAEGVKGDQFYGVKQDVESVADFIRLYTTRFGRWPSPKFLAGESYGTTRAAQLSEHLLERYGINLNGVILISSILHFQTVWAGGVNDLPYVLYVPTYAATAWFHNRLAPELQEDLNATLQEVEAWALEQYAPALAKGDALSDEVRQQVRDRLARYTGLPADLIEKAGLRIDPGLFQKNLLSNRRQIVGRFDSRLTGYELEPTRSSPEYDPSFPPYLAAYAGTFNDYVRNELGYQSDLPYEIISGKVHPWNMGNNGYGYLDVAGELRSAMAKNPHLKVLVASGYFDLATPYFASDYTVNHLQLSPELRTNVTQTYYPGGHMMYHHFDSLKQLQQDLGDFIRGARPGGMADR